MNLAGYANQDSDIAELTMRGSGDASGSAEPYYATSSFLLHFSLDDAALYSFGGTLSGTGAIAALCMEESCAGGSAVAYDVVDSAGAQVLPFDHQGALTAGEYWLHVEAYSVGPTTSFDFTFSVAPAPVPEPAGVALALIALLPLARRARR